MDREHHPPPPKQPLLLGAQTAKAQEIAQKPPHVFLAQNGVDQLQRTYCGIIRSQCRKATRSRRLLHLASLGAFHDRGNAHSARGADGNQAAATMLEETIVNTTTLDTVAGPQTGSSKIIQPIVEQSTAPTSAVTVVGIPVVITPLPQK